MRDLIGIPFSSGVEQTPEAGFDCWGLARYIFRLHGVILPDYRLDADDGDAFAACFCLERGNWHRHEWPGVPVPVPAVMAIRFPVVDIVSHVGVYIGDGKFLHTRQKTGVVIERVESPAWRRRIEGFYTPRGR